MGRQYVQFISIAIISAVLVIEIVWAFRNRDKWRWAVPITLWMMHAFVYYIFVIAGAQFVHDWSPILRLHGYISILILEANRTLKRGR